MLSENLGGVSQFCAAGELSLHAPFRFAELLAPVSVAKFCADYWARKPLLIKAQNPERYRALLSLDDIERCLYVEDLLPSESVTTPYLTDALPEPPPASVEEVYERLAAGKPLRMRRLEKILPPDAPVVALLRDMEATLRHPKASLSCYVAPSAKFGLGPHHDETEIFTLQICGSKRWRLFHKNVADEPGIWTRDGLDAPTAEFVLEPGDFFYLPGGLVHDVTVEDAAPSLSLTIVFDPFRWRELLDVLTQRLAGDDAFVEPLPAGATLGDGAGSFAHAFMQRIDRLRDELERLSPSALQDALTRKHLRKSAPAPRMRFAEVARLDALSLASVIENAPDAAPHVASDDDRVALILAGGYTFSAARAAEPALRDVLARRAPFRVAELHPALPAEAKLALARKLVACGVLRVVDYGSGA